MYERSTTYVLLGATCRERQCSPRHWSATLSHLRILHTAGRCTSFGSIHSEGVPEGANPLFGLQMLIWESISRLVFTQPLIGNYGVPSSARDENGLLKYFESPVGTSRAITSQLVAEHVCVYLTIDEDPVVRCSCLRGFSQNSQCLALSS